MIEANMAKEDLFLNECIGQIQTTNQQVRKAQLVPQQVRKAQLVPQLVP
jgi:hypothetical protein